MKTFFLIAILISAFAQAQLPAFPGAEGAGKFTTGGRGTAGSPTTVFEVTNLLDDMNPGSLRYAVSQTAANRTIVFRVSGTIHLQSKLTIRANTTIAGQTAPGDGICIADHPVVISGDNVIVRYIRFRLGDKNQNKGMVDGSGSDDALENIGNKNIIIDHCSVSWSSDEALTIYRGDSVTLQWNIISEPLNYSYHFEAGGTDFQEHAYIGIWGGRKASFHHNLLAHAKGRMPRFAGSSSYPPGTAGQENADFRNNVVYNWISYSTNGGEGGNYNLVNNYYKYGPSTSTNTSVGVPVRNQIMNPYKSASLPYPKLYINGNFVDGSSIITQNNWRGISMNGGTMADTALSKVNTPFNISNVTTHSATEAYELVLNFAGTVLPQRDTLDQRIVLDVRNRTGKVIDVQGGFPHGTPYAQTVNAWPFLQSGTPPVDTDKDGMPDNWETEYGLNPNNAADRNGIAVTGYTNLENYLNSLASDAIILKSSLNAFIQTGNFPSTVQTYLLTGKQLTGNVSLFAPAGFEISADGVNWLAAGLPLVLNAVNGNISTRNIYVRMHAATPGNFSGFIQHRSLAGGYVELPVNGTLSAITSLPTFEGEKELKVYPNPAHSLIRADHPAMKSGTLHVYAADGKRIFSMPVKQGQKYSDIRIEHLLPGMYFLELEQQKNKWLVSFIKN